MNNVNPNTVVLLGIAALTANLPVLWLCWGSLRLPPTYGGFVGLLGIAALTANLRGAS